MKRQFGLFAYIHAWIYYSSLSHTDAESQGRFLSCDQSFVYFGFVDIKCRVNRTVRLRNISSKSLNLKIQLRKKSRGYEVCLLPLNINLKLPVFIVYCLMMITLHELTGIRIF